MRRWIGAIVMCLTAGFALAQESKTDSEKEKAQAATPEASQEKEKAKEKEEFKPPRGYVTKKRGDAVVYCTKSREIGSRFVTEKCYDENQVRDLELAKELAKREFDQRRAIRASGGV